MKRIGLFVIVFFCISLLLHASGPRVLFIGDSITDGNWGNACGMPKPTAERSLWDMNHIYGSGYMYLCASHYQGDFPEKEYAFFNRGISGNTLRDLEKRWEEDAIGMKPDVLSVLVGTNDVHYCSIRNSPQVCMMSWKASLKVISYFPLLMSVRMEWEIWISSGKMTKRSIGHHHCISSSRNAYQGKMPLEYARMRRSMDRSPPTASNPSGSP